MYSRYTYKSMHLYKGIYTNTLIKHYNVTGSGFFFEAVTSERDF